MRFLRRLIARYRHMHHGCDEATLETVFYQAYRAPGWRRCPVCGQYFKLRNDGRWEPAVFDL